MICILPKTLGLALRAAALVATFAASAASADDLRLPLAVQAALTAERGADRAPAIAALTDAFDAPTFLRTLGFKTRAMAPADRDAVRDLARQRFALIVQWPPAGPYDVLTVPYARHDEPMGTLICASARVAAAEALVEAVDRRDRLTAAAEALLARHEAAVQGRLRALDREAYYLKMGIAPGAYRLLEWMEAIPVEDHDDPAALDRLLDRVEIDLKAQSAAVADATAFADAMKDCAAHLFLYRNADGAQPLTITVVRGVGTNRIVAAEAPPLRTLDRFLRAVAEAGPTVETARRVLGTR
ncbi:hypothetical protein DXV76_15705 [Rhodobacteraceae bacterium CCMM004]|nr:hypothetical protein DXV76_15705 [Rhodobacteraceae bacterium CCMM004]